MNPQYGYYQSGQNNCMNYGSQSQQTYGSYGTSASRPGSRSTYSRAPPTRTRSTCGYSSNQGGRASPAFSSPSSGNIYAKNYQQPWAGAGGKSQQNVGRAVHGPTVASSNMNYKQQAQNQMQHPLAPASFCTPQAIKVNVTAEQLANAKNAPFQDRGEASMEGNPDAKYIQLNWQDLLGGMDNLRVSMVPSCDPNNQNQQLKVSFGGQKTDPPQAGETSLKVVSIEPATTGRMEIQQGNAFAGNMKVCPPPAHMRMSPAVNTNKQQNPCYGGSYRR